jgi:hypothetical protein
VDLRGAYQRRGGTDGIDPETIRERQGHADAKTTGGYMHAKLAVQEAAAASLQARLSPKI